jgi:hypothetical protein
MGVMTKVDEEIKAAMRQFIAERGQKVEFKDPWYEGDTKEHVGIYGWVDFKAEEHIHPHACRQVDSLVRECGWVVPEGTLVKETTYTQFEGTFADNSEEIGINAYGCHCKCGKYQDVVLRVTSSLGDAIQALLGYDPTTQMQL